MMAVACGLWLGACNKQAQEDAGANVAATAKLPAPAMSVNRQMVSLIDNESHVLWGAEREGGEPRTDEDWQTIEDHALQIVAAGYMLQAGGTGPEDAAWSAQPEWRVQAKAMGEAAMAAATAAETKNMENLLSANGRLVDSCLACHERFKPEIPTEGRTHRHEYAT